MSEIEIEKRTCRFPGCSAKADQGEPGAGRPPEYCKDPAHNRGAAWRARKLERADLTGQPVPDDMGRPVAMARARAGEYVEQVTGLTEQLSRTLTAVVEELRTLGDPDAAAAQIEAVTAEAEERTAGAASRAARAEQDRREAEQDRREADAAAEEAAAEVEQLTTDLVTVREAHQGLEDAFALARAEHTQLVDQLVGERNQAAAGEVEQTTRADKAEQARDALHSRVEELRAEQEATKAAHVAALEDLRADRDRTSAELTSARAEHLQVVKDLRTELETVRADHTRTVEDLRADRDQVRAEHTAAKAEHDQAVKDLRAEHTAATKAARELSADRVTAAEATASDLRAQVEDLRGVIAELRAARDRALRDVETVAAVPPSPAPAPGEHRNEK